jgi:hypothetical protein
MASFSVVSKPVAKMSSEDFWDETEITFTGIISVDCSERFIFPSSWCPQETNSVPRQIQKLKVDIVFIVCRG